MSIAVSLEQLRDEVARRGDASFVVTTGDDGPHVVSVRVAWDGDDLVGGAGNRLRLPHVIHTSLVRVPDPPIGETRRSGASEAGSVTAW